MAERELAVMSLVTYDGYNYANGSYKYARIYGAREDNEERRERARARDRERD